MLELRGRARRVRLASRCSTASISWCRRPPSWPCSGPNGAGKSTTLKVVAGLLPVTDGDVIIAGRRVNGAAPESLARAGVCLVPEGRGIFPNLTVRENLRMASYTGIRLKEIEEEAYERFPALAERRSQSAGTLSGGEQQMLAMARAVATRPALLLLDELSMGLARSWSKTCTRRSRRSPARASPSWSSNSSPAPSSAWQTWRRSWCTDESRPSAPRPRSRTSCLAPIWVVETMIESQDRVAEFKSEIADLRLADPALARDRLLLRLGVALLAIGPLWTVVAYFISHQTKNPLQQRDALVSALIGVSLAIVGGALFLRYSIAGFLRFWMARLTYEQKAQTDRVVGAVTGVPAAEATARDGAVGKLSTAPRTLRRRRSPDQRRTAPQAPPPPRTCGAQALQALQEDRVLHRRRAAARARAAPRPRRR